MTTKIYQLMLLLILIALTACSDSRLSPEDEIRQYIKAGVEAAEARDAGDLAGLIHENYRDKNQQPKAQLKKLATLYFFRHKNIHLFTKINEIDFLSPTEAQVTMHVAMAGTIISDASVLSSLRARIYKFELSLLKEDEWLLTAASWAPADVGGLQ